MFRKWRESRAWRKRVENDDVLAEACREVDELWPALPPVTPPPIVSDCFHEYGRDF